MDDDELVRLVAARCGDALTEVELAAIEAAISDRAPPVMLDQNVPKSCLRRSTSSSGGSTR